MKFVLKKQGIEIIPFGFFWISIPQVTYVCVVSMIYIKLSYYIKEIMVFNRVF
jgi:hypothetical protein